MHYTEFSQIFSGSSNDPRERKNPLEGRALYSKLRIEGHSTSSKNGTLTEEAISRACYCAILFAQK